MDISAAEPTLETEWNEPVACIPPDVWFIDTLDVATGVAIVDWVIVCSCWWLVATALFEFTASWARISRDSWNIYMIVFFSFAEKMKFTWF